MNTLSLRDQRAIWHPFTQHAISPFAVPIVKGEGAYLVDEQGKRYLDLISSWWVNTCGHGHPLIAQAIYHQALQLEQVIFAGFTHLPAIQLAEKLLALLPKGFSKVFYSDNGSTAVEVAIKMAYQYWHNRGEKQRQRFLAFNGGYHGDTVGAMSLGQSSRFFEPFVNLLFKVDVAPFPATWEGDDDILQKEQKTLAWLDEYFKEHHHELAAIIIEPLIQGAGGMQVCRPVFLKDLECLARRYQLLIIYDEIMTGFGRSGALFACLKAGTQPDIICLAKGLTGGFLPLAVTVCKEHIYQAFLSQDSSFALTHGHSYTANPLGCAAALASLEILLSQEIQQQWRLIEESHQHFMTTLGALPIIEKVRHCGTLLAFNIIESTAYGSSKSHHWREQFFKRGLLLRPLGSVIYLLPPYCITLSDLNRAYNDIIEVIKNTIIKEKI